MRFPLRHLFLVSTVVGVLLWLMLLARWDARERIYIGLWSGAIGFAVCWPGLGHASRFLRVPLLLAAGTLTAGIAENWWFDVRQRVGHEFETGLLMIVLTGLAGCGSVTLLGVSAIYLDELTCLFQGSAIWRRCDRRWWKKRLVAVCVACAVAGTAIGTFWMPTFGTIRQLVMCGGIMSVTVVAVYLATVSVLAAIAGCWQTLLNWRTRSWMRRWSALAGLTAMAFAMWSIRDAQSRRSGTRSFTGSTRSIAISADGSRFAVFTDASTGGPLAIGAKLDTITVFDWETLKPVSEIYAPKLALNIAFLGDSHDLLFGESVTGGNFYSGTLEHLVIASGESGERLRQTSALTAAGPAYYLQPSADGQRCWVVIPTPGLPREKGPYDVHEWDLRDLSLSNRVTILADLTTDGYPSLQPSSRRFVTAETANRQSTLRVIRLGDQKPEVTIQSPIRVHKVDLSPNGRWLSTDRFLWNLETTSKFEIDASPRWFPSFTADSRRLVTQHWRFGKLEYLRLLLESFPVWRHVHGLHPETMRIFDVATRRLIAENRDWPSSTRLWVMSADGSRIVGSGWDAYTGQPTVTLLEMPELRK